MASGAMAHHISSAVRQKPCGDLVHAIRLVCENDKVHRSWEGGLKATPRPTVLHPDYWLRALRRQLLPDPCHGVLLIVRAPIWFTGWWACW
jgi:hypothetical protein